MNRGIEDAVKILKLNYKNKFTVPSNNLYPHQWSWDSGWIVYGYCALNETKKAENELLSLLEGQWDNGLIPSIVFHNKQSKDYFPGYKYWDLENKANDLTKVFNTTGIVQPPIHSHSCFKIYEKNKNINFLKNIEDKLFKWHKYLYDNRDINNEGLVFIRHPWESGMDNSPIWDESLESIKIDEFKYSLKRIDKHKVNEDERPTDITYERYMYLIDLFKKHKYNEKKISEDCPFLIQDVLFNVLLLKSNYALLEIYKILKDDQKLNIVNNWIEKTSKSINEKLFKEDFYYSFDLVRTKLVNIKTITGLTPIILNFNVDLIKKNLNDSFLNCHYKIASLDRSESVFDPINYWRGPMWINLSWMIYNGLQNNGYFSLAKKIKNTCLSQIDKFGFYEYYNSVDDNGCGDNYFSWTASIYVCFITDYKF